MTEQSKKDQIWPRFLGQDNSGDFVWELPNGRWTWGNDPASAMTRKRTFTPDRYQEKYGPVEPLVEIEPGTGNGPVVKMGGVPVEMLGVGPIITVERTSETAQADKMAGAVAALAAMERTAKGWADTAHENDASMGRQNTLPSGQQPFVLADILRMIDDAAREVGVAPVYSDLAKLDGQLKGEG